MADQPLILTLDAGGTTMAFTAMRGYEAIGETLERPSHADNLEVCLKTIREGFEELAGKTGTPDALSFAFPGPADYANGIIGDLGNLPAFRGGVPLGPMLEDQFGCPVYINNDGDLFALGEASRGILPWLNRQLEENGSNKRYRNLLGITLGTGMGAGIVNDGKLFVGDNNAGGEIWLLHDTEKPEQNIEEAVSIRAVRRYYAKIAGVKVEDVPEPRILHDIAVGKEKGNANAARKAFQQMGRAAGLAITQAVTLLDAPVVIGGGLSKAAPLFLPTLVQAMREPFSIPNGETIAPLESEVFNLEADGERNTFLQIRDRTVKVPGTKRAVTYDARKRIPVGLSKLGAGRAVAVGAYAFAMEKLDG